MSQIIDIAGFTPDGWAGTPIPALADYAGGEAVLIGAQTDPAALVSHFAALRLIVIPFASSADGRGFSLAGQLRALGYDGHLRARGHMLVDQFRAALRAGFDDIEISDAQAARNPEPQWLAVPLTRGYRSRLFAA